MKGAFIGDIVGSRFEWTGFREKEFDLFAEGCRVTDDSLMTAAVAEAFLTMRETDLPETESVLGPLLCERMRRLGRTYPDAGYGQKFKAWLMDETMGPYGSGGGGGGFSHHAVTRELREWSGHARFSGWLVCLHLGGSRGTGSYFLPCEP